MNTTIIDIASDAYQLFATRLLDELSGKNYFSGSFEFEVGDYSARLVATLFIYYTQVRQPDTEVTFISDIVPVWWELHTCIDGQEFLNNFSFNELREYINDMQNI